MEPVNSVNIQNMQPIECSICLEDVQDNKVFLACKHIFHMACLEPWREKSDSCPVCRTVIQIIPNNPLTDLLSTIRSLYQLTEIASRYPNANLIPLKDSSFELLQFYEVVKNLQLHNIVYQKRVETLDLSEFKTLNTLIQKTINRIELFCALDWMYRANVVAICNKIDSYLKKSCELLSKN